MRSLFASLEEGSWVFDCASRLSAKAATSRKTIDRMIQTVQSMRLMLKPASVNCKRSPGCWAPRGVIVRVDAVGEVEAARRGGQALRFRLG